MAVCRGDGEAMEPMVKGENAEVVASLPVSWFLASGVPRAGSHLFGG